MSFPEGITSLSLKSLMFRIFHGYRLIVELMLSGRPCLRASDKPFPKRWDLKHGLIFAARDCVLDTFDVFSIVCSPRGIGLDPPRKGAMILISWPASLLCLLLGYVGVNPAFQADVEKPAVRQIPVSYRNMRAELEIIY